MEKLISCPVCGKSNFTPFLQSSDFFLTKEEYTIVICNSCGMKFINPRPEANEISKYYESPDYISHDAGKKSGLNFLYKQVRNFLIKKKYRLVKEYSKGKKLLDIGCGTGEFIFFCKKNGFDVTGIEPGEIPRFFAQTEYKLDIHEEAYLDNLSHPEFDVITLWHVLEHVHLLHERMNKIVEIMKPDGTLIIAVPNSNSWDARYYGKFWAAYDLPRHLYHFSRGTLQILAQDHALQIDKIIPMKFDAFYISLLSEKYAKEKKNYFKAVINGIRSNKFAKKNDKNYSSLIFVLKKAKI
ncbi:MAG: class I SAM-dependent methyltransferase [Bacteroidales bacterium]|jgi:2-polyprenyl-3-methyl-5-hydroxy-6-metoxy-1,4-benzoquinol methylase